MLEVIDGGGPARFGKVSGQGGDGSALVEIRRILDERTGRDTSGYKLATLQRTVDRRLAVHGMCMAEYLDLLQHDGVECSVLLQKLCIGFTRFFRDSDAFAALAVHLEQRIVARDEPMRVWCAGCSTGEEAYSLAILLDEIARALGAQLPIRIYATDIDERALRLARRGSFERSAIEALGPERLRYFAATEDGYRVGSRIRDMIVFAGHDALVDPPFARFDLVSCRNLLIYLDPHAQRRLLGRFHAALVPGGSLFLGQAEAAEFDGLFEVLCRRHRIFRRSGAGRGRLYQLAMPRVRPRATAAPAAVRDRINALLVAYDGPACALVNDESEVLHVRGDLTAFLGDGLAGQPASLIQAAPVRLGAVIAVCMREAASGDEVRRTTRITGVDGAPALVTISVRRIFDPELLQGLTLVAFAGCPEPQHGEHLPDDLIALLEDQL